MEGSKILITGANGQLGKALQARYPGAKATDSTELDITDSSAVNNFDFSGVGVIINAAAYTNVDGAETPEGRLAAWKVNSQAVANLAEAARKNNITLIHVSSEYVFDGTKDNHLEDEPVSPLSVYGASKAAGDIVLSTYEKHYLLRTSWVIGDGKNFVRTMLDLAEKNISPTVVNDQIGRLTFTSVLVDAIDHMLSKNAPFGTYNISNEGEPVSWADISRTIFHEAGFDLQVTNTTTEEYYRDKADAAPRPLKSTLSLEKIKAAGFEPHNWHDDLREYIKKELNK